MYNILQSQGAEEIIGGRAIPIYSQGAEEVKFCIGLAWQRWNVFLSLLSDHCKVNPTSRVLELGANPYLFTTLLHRLTPHIWTGGCYPGRLPQSHGDMPIGTVRIHSTDGSFEIPLELFNVEMDRFPYGDDHFDVVICGELIEHLIFSPSWMLCEINRVLKPGGWLLLSTPNAVALTRLMLMIKGVNVYDPFSRYGVYGRHNREYTCPELRELLQGHNLTPVVMCTHNFFEHEWGWYPCGLVGWVKYTIMDFFYSAACFSRGILKERGDSIVVLAQKTGEPVLYHPGFLYHSKDCIPMFSDVERESQS